MANPSECCIFPRANKRERNNMEIIKARIKITRFNIVTLSRIELTPSERYSFLIDKFVIPFLSEFEKT